MRRLTALLVLVAAGSGSLAIHSRASQLDLSVLSPTVILQRSLSTMAAVRDIHAIGHSTERAVESSDPSSAGSWRIQGDCTSHGTAALARFSFRGKQTGRHIETVNQQYVVRATRYQANPTLWWPGWSVWSRLAHPLGSWHRTGVTHDARIVSSMCPSLIVPQLRLHLPGPLDDMGRIEIGGRHAEHLQSSFNGQGGGDTVDLYVDLVSFRWTRVGLSGWGAGCCHAYHNTFEYSRFDIPLHITSPVEIPTRAKLDQTESTPPKLRLRLLAIRSGVPLTAQATITGPSVCTLTVTATRRNGTRKVIFTGADHDGPRHGEYVGNYMVLAKVPPATKLISASATCGYSTRGRSRRVKVSARLVVK